jgi:hypothetical protein
VLKLPAAGEAAIAADKLWFAQNPEKTRRQRRVRQRELPVELRALDIGEVRIERVGPSWLLRTLLDRNGKAVAGGWEMYDAPIVPDAPDGTVNMTQRGECFVDKTGFSAADREYFEQHPRETSYTRPITPEEMVLVVTPPGYECIGGTVTVTKIDKGVRMRQVNACIAPINERPPQ